MQGVEVRKTEYGFVDVMKFLLALLIVSSHFISENAVGRINNLVDYASSLYVIVVPFFFACSGFLLFRKLKGGADDWLKVKAYCKKILIMYAGWSVLYLLFTILTWIRFGTTAEKVLHYLLSAVTYSTYKTIWFLPATVIGVLLTYFFKKKIDVKGTLVVGIIFYLIGCIGASYSFLIPENGILNVYNYIFSSTRNGFFNGFPFVLIGYLIAQKEQSGFVETRMKNFIFTVIFGIAFVAEALLIKRRGAMNVNTLLFLLPFTYYFLQWCLGIRMKITGKTMWMRKMSTDIFLCQRLFLSALPALFPASIFGRLLTGNPYVGWMAMLVLSLLTAAILIEISKRNKWLAKFC